MAAELPTAGARVTIAVRSGARVVPRDLLGVPIQYLAVAISRLPRHVQRSIASVFAQISALTRDPAVLPPPSKEKCSDVPLIGFHLVDAIRAGTIELKGGVAELTAGGARFQNGTEDQFDDVILATGYRAAVGVLGSLIRTDGCGFSDSRSRPPEGGSHAYAELTATIPSVAASRRAQHDEQLSDDAQQQDRKEPEPGRGVAGNDGSLGGGL